jgi:hypothetical protein
VQKQEPAPPYEYSEITTPSLPWDIKIFILPVKAQDMRAELPAPQSMV